MKYNLIIINYENDEEDVDILFNSAQELEEYLEDIEFTSTIVCVLP